MLVILRENVSNLGGVGEVVKVSDGYARNFLIPHHLAYQADQRKLNELEHRKRLLEKKRLAQKAHRKELAEKLSAFTCTIARKAAEGDKIFGSVTVQHIHEQIVAAGYEIDKTTILLSKPIRTLGLHAIDVKLDSDVQTSIQVSVVKE